MLGFNELKDQWVAKGVELCASYPAVVRFVFRTEMS